MSSAEDIERLRKWLQTALQLELTTIPPYLVALLSIRLPSNREAAELIRSVLIEEMLHVALVANVLSAVGGRARFGADGVPSFPLELTFEGETFADRRFPVELRPFSLAAVEMFLRIELPQRRSLESGYAAEMEVPGLTIGRFYQRIIDLLVQLNDAAPGALFTGNPAWQVDGGYYWGGGGNIVRVVDLATAREALQTVMDQGEAAWEQAAALRLANARSHFDIGHYYRFSQIAHGRRYRPEDDPSGPPTGTEIRVDYDAVYPFKPNPSAADYQGGLAELNDMFNSRYTVMLAQLEEAFSGTPKTLYTAIMDSMHELTPLAHEMMKRPYPGDAEGRTACPTFDWTPVSSGARIV